MPKTEVSPPSTAPAKAALQQMRRASAGFREHASGAKAPAAYAAMLSAKPVLSEGIFIGSFHHGWMKGLLGSLAQPILCGPYFPSLICNAIRLPSPVPGLGTDPLKKHYAERPSDHRSEGFYLSLKTLLHRPTIVPRTMISLLHRHSSIPTTLSRPPIPRKVHWTILWQNSIQH
jgi:hypothetical protein